MRKFRIVLFICAGSALAQIGPPAGQTGGSQATQLPLSGRTGQSGSVNATETPIPGTTSSVNTLNTSVQTEGPYAGSRSGVSQQPFSGKLSMREAVERGLAYNLGTVGLNTAVRQSRGQARVARSALLPNLNGALRETVEQVNLAASGVRFNAPIPGFNIPNVVGHAPAFLAAARVSTYKFQFFFSPKAPTKGGIIWGVGPTLFVPTGTDPLLAGRTWGAGVDGVVLTQIPQRAGVWTVGILGSQTWSFAGPAAINMLFLQPFVAFTFKPRLAPLDERRMSFRSRWAPIRSVMLNSDHREPRIRDVGGDQLCT